MVLNIYNGKQLINTFDGDFALKTFISDLYNYAIKDGAITRMKENKLNELGTVRFTLKTQSFGTYSHEFTEVPFELGYLDVWKMLERK